MFQYVIFVRDKKGTEFLETTKRFCVEYWDSWNIGWDARATQVPHVLTDFIWMYLYATADQNIVNRSYYIAASSALIGCEGHTHRLWTNMIGPFDHALHLAGSTGAPDTLLCSNS